MVLAAQLDAVDAGFGRRGIDQPLHIVIGLGAAGAAIGADRRRVGEGAFGRDLDQRGPVNAEGVADGIAGRRAGSAIGGAEIAVAGQPHREEIAVAVERQFGGHLVVAAVAVGDEAARALVGPFDRAAQFARRVQDAVIFAIGRLLHAKRAADPVGQDAQLVAADAEHLGDVVAKAEHPLAADIEGPVPALGVVAGDRRARLHRVDDDAVVAQHQAGDMGGAGKGGGDLVAVAIVEIEPDIGRDLVVEQRGIGRRRGARGGHRRQRVDVDFDQFGGVLGGGNGQGDHRGDRFADMAHLAGGERVMRRGQHRRAVAVVHDLPRRQAADAAGRQIGRGIDR